MIDLDDPKEYLLTAEGAADWLAGRGAGKVSPRTVWRWISTGIMAGGKRVRLESCKVGGFRYTSTGALARFVAAQSEAGANPAPKPAPPEDADAIRRAFLDAMR